MEKLNSKNSLQIITILLFGYFMAGVNGLCAQTTASNPLLTLKPGEAKLLGQYNGSILAGCENKYPSSITDYSGYVLDTTRNSILMFGGGHAAIPRTDVDVLDLNQTTFFWKSDYAPTPVAEQVPAN
jgi:hypothetical protein